MAGILLIYVVTLTVLGATGTVALLVLKLERPRLGSGALPLGACVLVVLAHWLGFLLTGRVVAVVLLVLIVLAGAAAAIRWRRRGMPWPHRVDGLVVGVGALLGAALLAPLFALGFPTTIASGIADGWARAVLTEWLLENPLRESVTSRGFERPLGTYSALPPALGAGFEYIAGTVATVLAKPAFEVAMILAATSVPLAVCGWVRLWEELAGERPRVWQLLIISAASLSPAFVLGYAENYLTQMFSLALWPFAAAAMLAFFRRPGPANATIAAVALGAIAGIYPPLLPWVVPVVPVLALIMATGRRRFGRVAAAVRNVLLLGVAVAVLAPFELWRAWEAVTTVSGLRSNPAFPVLRIREAAGILLGGITQFQVPPFADPVGAAALAMTLGVLLLVVSIALASGFLWRPARATLLALAAIPTAVTASLYLKYKFGDDYGYGGYKAALYGGSLLAGVLLVALAYPGLPLRPVRGVALGLCLALWLPLTASLLDRQLHGAQGFRQADRALYHALRDLPDDAVLLVEGAAETSTSFQMRMSAGYLGQALDMPVEGVGTTYTYATGGGHAEWRPARPWSHVLVSGAPSPFEALRRTIWESGVYRLQVAEDLDVTPYALARPESSGLPPSMVRFWAPAAADSTTPVSYIAGPVEMVVANRLPQPQKARLTVTFTGMDAARDLRLRFSVAGRRPRTVKVAGTTTHTVSYEVPVGPRATSVVAVTPAELELVDGQPPPVLAAVTHVDVEPV